MAIENINKWVDEKMRECRVDKEQTLNEMLENTTDIIRQFLNSSESKGAKSVLETCCKSNEMFLEILNGQG